MSKIIEKEKVTVVKTEMYNVAIDEIKSLLSYINSVSEHSLNKEVRDKITYALVKTYDFANGSKIEERETTTIKPKNIGKNIVDKIPFEIKVKKKKEA